MSLLRLLFLACASHTIASVEQNVGSEEFAETSVVDDSCSEVVLLQTKTEFQKQQYVSDPEEDKKKVLEEGKKLMQHIEEEKKKVVLDAKVQAAHHVAGRKDIIWSHLHNYGGTTMCNEADKQGEVLPNQTYEQIGIPAKLNPNLNCNVLLDVCGNHLAQLQTDILLVHCDERKGFTFSEIERALTDEDVKCNDKLYGTMLRDPLSAQRSTYVNDLFSVAEKQNILSAIRNGYSSASVSGNDHSCLPSWDTYQHFDNFATRTLSGAYAVPGGMMEDKHLEKAKARLMKMDVVMILEEFETHSVQLEAVFGWNMSAAVGKSGHNAHNATLLAEAFTEEEEEFLRKVNHFDYELYAFGSSLAQNRSAAARVLLSSA